jgi:hypothetical protein
VGAAGVGGQAAVGLAEPAGRVACDQGNDPAALQLRQPPGPTRAGLVAEVVDAALVEAVQPAVDGAWMAAELGGDLADLGAVPAQGDDAGALQPACGGVAGMSEPTDATLLGRIAGGRANSGGSMAPLLCHKVRNTTREPSSHKGLKERSTSVPSR